jgi:hypothetical protein
MPQISRNERGFNNKTHKKDVASKKKKENVMTRMLRVTRDDRWTSRNPNHLAEPLTTVPKDNRTSASDNNKNYHFVSTPPFPSYPNEPAPMGRRNLVTTKIAI